ncbi:MAG: aminodeoxychorismate/anthranilate synthase component II [Planctomycetota bacterium]
MILVIDNYDSFTYNLVQRIGELYVRQGKPEPDLRVERNDKISAAEAARLSPSHVIVSPGPCTPSEAGVSCAAIDELAGRVPLLGVCLGHQSIGQVFGMTVARHAKLMHGKTSAIAHDGKTIFEGLSNPFVATRYHSLVITAETFDDGRFETSAWCEDDGRKVVMGLRARAGALGAGRDAPLEGVQFHPESFMTLEGPLLLANFLGLPRPEPEASPVEVPLG